MPNKLVLQ